MAQKMSFIIACKKFFGMKEDQSLSEFGDEIKALTDEDRAELAPLLGEALEAEVSTGPLTPTAS